MLEEEVSYADLKDDPAHQTKLKNDEEPSISLNTLESSSPRTPKKISLDESSPLLPGKNIPEPPPSSPISEPIYHYQTKAVEVIEDFYGTYTDSNGRFHHIKRFTWKNYNKLTISVITYGARIITMRAPDKRGKIVDILLGFDDMAGHVENSPFPLGGCLGRCAHFIKDAKFYLDHNINHLTRNAEKHHHNGGEWGFDKVVWTPYVDKSKVIMSYLSAHKEEGYPGQLFTKITFELCKKNQFRIDYEAHCTEPTVVNLTHLCYFNLAGSNQGPQEIYNHILTMNANCYTIQDDDKIPTGEMKNVVNSIYDFQIPKCLNKVIGLKPGDGYDQNFCVNCSADQQECFVARLFHPPTGRMIEIYSSQKGVVFTTGNEFGTGAPMSIEKLLEKPHTGSTTSLVVGHIYKNLREILEIDNKNDYFEMRKLIDLIKGVNLGDKENMDKIELTKLQRRYLEKILQYCNTCEPKLKKCTDIISAIEEILKASLPKHASSGELEVIEEHQIRERILSHFSANLSELIEKTSMRKPRVTGKIVGKNDYLYNAHCGVALTPGNYPNAVNTNGFPNVILRPGQVYRQVTSYRFWVRAGNPNNWIKRKLYEATHDAKEAAKELDKATAAKILGLDFKKDTTEKD